MENLEYDKLAMKGHCDFMEGILSGRIPNGIGREPIQKIRKRYHKRKNDVRWNKSIKRRAF